MGLVSANASVDCLALSVAVKNAATANQSGVLELVSREVAAAPGCACEIVKAAIEGSKAEPKMVAAIVQAASTAAPEQLRLISQCAVAVAPDALSAVQGVIALLDPNLGETASANSAKGAKAPAGEVAADFNPLDFPGQGPVGPTPGGPGGLFLTPVLPPATFVPPVNVQRRVVQEKGPPIVIPPLPPVSPGNPSPGGPPAGLPPGPPAGVPPGPPFETPPVG